MSLRKLQTVKSRELCHCSSFNMVVFMCLYVIIFPRFINTVCFIVSIFFVTRFNKDQSIILITHSRAAHLAAGAREKFTD